jgi:hypothetical protein
MKKCNFIVTVLYYGIETTHIRLALALIICIFLSSFADRIYIIIDVLDDFLFKKLRNQVGG